MVQENGRASGPVTYETIMKTSRAILALMLLAPCVIEAQSGRPITFQDFAAIKTVSDPQLSPDGRTVLYAVRSTDVDANRRSTTTYAVALGDGTPRAFPDDTTHAVEAR